MTAQSTLDSTPGKAAACAAAQIARIAPSTVDIDAGGAPADEAAEAATAAATAAGGGGGGGAPVGFVN